MQSFVLKHNQRQSARLTELDGEEIGQVSGGDGIGDTTDGVCSNGQPADVTVYSSGKPATWDC